MNKEYLRHLLITRMRALQAEIKVCAECLKELEPEKKGDTVDETPAKP